MTSLQDLEIPDALLPADGRFGAGPSRIRPAQIETLTGAGRTLLGTSHRQAPVKDLVRRVREGLSALFALPDGHEIVLGNGGSTAFWDIATLCLIERRSQHAVHGEFSGKFASAVDAAPFLEDPYVRRAEPGSLAQVEASDEVDVYAYPHNETSTGVLSPVTRSQGARSDQLVLVDGTSAAGGVAVDLQGIDAYYFAPQKCLGSDGGLWLAALSPAALERAERLAASDRWIPEFLSLPVAVANSRKQQTLNTPAVATLLLLAEQVEWLLAQGGLSWADARTRATSGLLHAWVERREELSFFVTEPAARSTVVTTIDVDPRIDATEVTALLRRHGVVDIEPYRKLGRNQLRIATFPSVPEEDVQALIAVLDLVLDRAVDLASR
ncbi:phosphoserine transaminase [Brachybacterium sp. EF45031]|uniref:phosphoserine transaminase n=1 Tax=Brachybacterium sillae TaxID=2810536 RepID=UPI00217E5B46|nr:phosphoserine transaminase [Brachybacterium sillae]MCS6712671.1 phosphoserine transaminase [Brachybacterium sillae]